MCKRTPDNFQDMRHKRRQYKAFVKRNKMRHMCTKARQMNDMKGKSPIEFGNMFRETKRTTGESVSVEDVVDHFKNLASHHSETDREVDEEVHRHDEQFSTIRRG